MSLLVSSRLILGPAALRFPIGAQVCTGGLVPESHARRPRERNVALLRTPSSASYFTSPGLSSGMSVFARPRAVLASTPSQSSRFGMAEVNSRRRLPTRCSLGCRGGLRFVCQARRAHQRSGRPISGEGRLTAIVNERSYATATASFRGPSASTAALPASFFAPSQTLAPSAYTPSAHRPASDDPARAPLSGPLLLPTTPSAAIVAGYQPVPSLTPRVLRKAYMALSKANLTLLVTLTAMAGYALCPASLAVASGPTVLLALTFGTATCSAAANSLNQLIEAPYDAQMPRTRNRPLPARMLTPLHAACFAGIASVSGIATLALAVNPLTAALGATNIVLYSFIYTPLKRIHIANTWVGSLVGGLPPLMGWAAATGSLSGVSDLPGWLLAALLFAWQFPHFNALSHNLRSEYARGGYRMMSASHPLLNRRTSLRYAIACTPLCIGLAYTSAVSPLYALLSLAPNLVLAHAAWKFWKFENDKAARWCFWVSLVHLPAVIILAMVCKTGLWDGVSQKLGLTKQHQELHVSPRRTADAPRLVENASSTKKTSK